MEKTKSNQNKHYNWLMGADMYLCSSVILCKEMLNTYNAPQVYLSITDKLDKKCDFTSCNQDYEMLLPVIFNLKHGIELYLKSIIMKLDSKREYPSSHNLIFLLNKVILLEKEHKNNTNILNILDKDIRKIIEKYYFGTYAFSKNHANPDINNEAERYPEYKKFNCYKVENLDKLNMNILLNQIKKDCIDIQMLFRENIWKSLITKIS